MKTIVQTPVVGDSRFKRWSKTVSHVDTSKTNGYSFEGEFIQSKVELEIGSFILAWGQEGSRAHNSPLVRLYRVATDGLEKCYEKDNLSEHWALDCRDEIAAIVNTQPAAPENPLTQFSTEQLVAELARRNSS